MSDPSPTSSPQRAERQPAASIPVREAVRGGHPPVDRLAWPGVEQVRAIFNGETPAPPISRLTGMRLTQFGAGTATFMLPLSRWLTGPNGSISLGVLTMPADAAMGCAIMTELPAQTPITTAELSLRLLRAPLPGGVARARARVVHAGAPLVLAEVELHDERGLLIAHGSSLYMTLGASSYRAPVQTASPDQHGDGPDPWERELETEVRAPIELLTGLTPMAAADGQATFALPASPWFCAPPPGRVQGGMVAVLAEAAMEGAAATQAPPGTVYAPVDLKINYLRPLASDGGETRAQARTLRTGRRIAVVSAEVHDAARRPVALATGSGLFAPRA
jgi:uncharacterized protein (TIGR00369 family)